MEIITHLTDCDFYPGACSGNVSTYSIRTATRAVLSNEFDEVCLLWVAQFDVYKLPGGGLWGDEMLVRGLKREILEETGFRIKPKTVHKLGLTMEFRDQWNMVQISHCYACDAGERTDLQKLTREEKSAGFEVVWARRLEAETLVESHLSDDYDALYMRRRDLSIIKRANTLKNLNQPAEPDSE